MIALIVGGIAVAAASFVGGVTGFGYGLISTPVLLLSGFSLPFVVTVNLAASLVTRLSTAYRLRSHVTWRRTSLLVAGSIPGLYLGARVLTAVDPTAIKISIGVLVIGLSAHLARRSRLPAPRPMPGASFAAGLAGGFLGTISSLNGIVPALLLAREKVAPIASIADLAAYFVLSNTIGLGVLAATHGLSTRALFPALPAWLPGALLANLIGVTLAPRLPEQRFRQLTLAIVAVAGVLTIATAR